jgi:DNA/RNA-binding domain of Phe-tRNA-synthetase-like protein
MNNNGSASTLTVEVDTHILQQYPRLRISGIAVSSVRPHHENYPQLQEYLTQVQAAFHPDDSRYQAAIQRWRSTYQSMGIKPSKYHCSLESLYRRMTKGRLSFGIHPLVDLYNAVSLRHALCLGGYDWDRLTAPIRLLTLTKPAHMTPIGSKQPLHLPAGAIVYTSGSAVICAYWNHRDADDTKINDATQNALFFIDETEEEEGRAEEALADLEKILAIPGTSFSQRFSLTVQNPTQTLNLP